MWNDRLRFAERVEGDWRSLPHERRELLRRILERIDEEPIAGSPLLEPFRGLWVVIEEGIRVIYLLSPEARNVVVLKIDEIGKDR